MTKRVHSLETFRGWHYKRDPTHVCFFSLDTFAWLADRLAAHWLVVSDDVVLFQKPLNR